MKLSRILVPTDFSGPSREATDYAVDLARACGASIDLIHVMLDPVVYPPAMAGYTPLTRNEMEEYSEQALANWIDPAKAGGLHVERHWRHGHPVTEILDFARKHKSDIIVMGTHGRGMVAHVLIGSVAERVVRRAKCPVLTVHPTAAPESAAQTVVAAAEG